MFYIDVLVFPIYRMDNFICRNWTKIKRYFYFSPRGREKIWPCKVGRDEKNLKSTDINNSFLKFMLTLLLLIQFKNNYSYTKTTPEFTEEKEKKINKQTRNND